METEPGGSIQGCSPAPRDSTEAGDLIWKPAGFDPWGKGRADLGLQGQVFLCPIFEISGFRTHLGPQGFQVLVSRGLGVPSSPLFKEAESCWEMLETLFASRSYQETKRGHESGKGHRWGVIWHHTAPQHIGASPQAPKGTVEVCLGVPARPAFQQRLAMSHPSPDRVGGGPWKVLR